MAEKLETCGTCKHTKHDTVDWYCANKDSECFTCYMDYRDACGDWEGKDEA